ncbi:MDR family MFS transporter [Streptomyces sp. CB02959]|uniref:MDR family MFS transporter n=1 Tax=Streptomyces sp. CB02959 TaxID=2020330 RepID=UPI0021536A2C|nr:MDR family MFS transporter [Streptomyces sp. CB02959]
MSQGQPANGELLRGPRLYVVMAAAVLAMLLGSLDSMILGAAMPRIVGELGGLDRLSWLVTAYMLTIAVSTPVWGKLGDMYGHKGAFIWAIVLFLAGSVLSGMAQTMTQLIAFRALQGLGGGGLMVGALAIIGTLVPPRQQGKYQGVISAVMGLAMVGGPLIGGVIADQLGWRWCFYVNVPVGAAALIMITGLHLPRRPTQARIDIAGVIWLTVVISAVVLVTTWGGKDYAWTSPPILALLALAVAALLALLYVERRATAPLLPLALFKNANFALITVAGLFLGCVMTSAVTFLPIFQQVVQHASATNAGLLLLPMFAAMVAVSAFGGQFITKSGKYKAFVVLGGASLTAGSLLLSWTDRGTSPLVLGVFMAALGLGMGLLTQTTLLISLQSAELKDLGVASSTATLARSLGGSVGVAISGALFAGAVTGARTADGTPVNATGGAQPDPTVLARLPHALRQAYENAVADGTSRIFLFCTVLAALALLAGCFVKEVPLRTANTPQDNDTTDPVPTTPTPTPTAPDPATPTALDPAHPSSPANP